MISIKEFLHRNIPVSSLFGTDTVVVVNADSICIELKGDCFKEGDGGNNGLSDAECDFVFKLDEIDSPSDVILYSQ